MLRHAHFYMKGGYVRFPFSLRNVEELLHERNIDISHETVRFCGADLARRLLLTLAGKGSDRCAHIPLQSK
jgi:transposase-like protein